MQLYMKEGCVIVPFEEVGDAMEVFRELLQFLGKRNRPPRFLGLPVNTKNIVDDKLIITIRKIWRVIEKGKKRKREVERAFLILPVQGYLYESNFKYNQLIKVEGQTVEGTKKHLGRCKNKLLDIEDRCSLLHQFNRPDWLYNGTYINASSILKDCL